MQKLALIILICLFFGFSCQEKKSTEILWDSWGVPHIYAKNNQELFFSFGWAQMHSHANTILQLYGKSRGQASEYWGEEYVENDVIIHTLGFPDLSQQWFETQASEMKGYIQEFVRGMNHYAETYPETISGENKVVLPIKNEDILAHFLFVVYTRFIGGGEFGKVQDWEHMGSNTYAIGPSKSESGNAMLVMNPHLPWFGEFLFYESQLVTPDMNAYGATLVGLPVLGIAFNEHLGWSHTNNTLDNADLYELTLQDGGYLLDGEVKNFNKKQSSIKIKRHDGEFSEMKIDILQSVQGPVVSKKNNKALAIRMPGYDNPNTALQWWNMSRANNFTEFENAIKGLNIPFWNIMYADQDGNIFYLFNGQVPKRSEGDWDFWGNIVDGARSDLVWDEIHQYDELPKVLNPPQGWMQNANDPPWTSTFPMALNPDDFPDYMSPRGMSFRPQRAVRMLMEDEEISFEELVSYKLSTRMELADRILDDLFVAIDEYGTDISRDAKAVLENWDREANSDSKGTFLFCQWFQDMRTFAPEIFSTPWSFENPRNTPDGLADPDKAVEVLNNTANQIIENYDALDINWGDVYRLHYADYDLPGNGANGGFGIFRVAWPGGFEDGKYTIGGGDSWQGIIEFGDKVRAKVLLSYGNSTQEGSEHYGDQLELFSKKEMRDAWFYKNDVEKHLEKHEILKGSNFTQSDQD